MSVETEFVNLLFDSRAVRTVTGDVKRNIRESFAYQAGRFDKNIDAFHLPQIGHDSDMPPSVRLGRYPWGEATVRSQIDAVLKHDHLGRGRRFVSEDGLARSGAVGDGGGDESIEQPAEPPVRRCHPM